ncbi:Rhs element Vgr protein [Duganella sp. CF458]|uniref:type VI secretion system Vgr family protein n=1 Tax=Duganella sp. CF458 TaxID=1884368 RepID=UPI0008EFB28C|nr:type VI secretion system Vgr family protein [Duganella sp. CF458]SFG57694.1 Rhs element Vgr protein [Duganella sp. CF458]
MRTELLSQAYAALAQFASESRLYELTLESDGDGGAGGLLVEAFLADDCLQEIASRDVIALSTSATIDPASLLGRRACLQASLADGSRTAFHGYISHAAMLGSEGGFARYRLRMSSWLWLATQTRNSRVWQDRGVADIVDQVFARFAPYATWQWSDDARALLDAIPLRSYCCQYRESDYDFVRRLLTEEGCAWRCADGEEEQTLVLFADSSQQSATPEDASSAAGQGLRYHAARAGEQFDTIQSLQPMRQLVSGAVAVLSYDYQAKAAVSATVPTRVNDLGKHAYQPESYDYPGQYFYSDGAQAERYATLHMQLQEARGQQCQGRSTVRTLRAGTRFTMTQGALFANDEDTCYVALRVLGVGVNNLPIAAKRGLAELFGPIPELLDTLATQTRDLPQDFATTVEKASASGYANSFAALAADVPWRPAHHDGEGRQHAKPTALGAQSAIVVGADGQHLPQGGNEIHCDRLGRVRIRFHWQDSADATCWVRVAQRSAGGSMGSQFLPRIGQEVLVQFIENDIDRPVIVAALYNGQGESGNAPTPGGSSAQEGSDYFGQAHDHATSAQGNLVGGNGPVWHGSGGGSGAHRNASALWGVRSKEFGGSGYNQLLFDDTDHQGRLQLRTTQAATELNLGHLVHNTDNYRGSLRGQGAELRTDAYGAVRAGAGLLVTSYKLTHSPAQREPAGDNTAGIALLKQAVKLGETFSDIAVKHGTVGLASHMGAHKTHASALDDNEAPLKSLLSAVSGMVDDASLDAAQADAGARKAGAGAGKLPHSADPIIAVSAKDGLSISAARDLQMAAGETATVMSGADTQLATGGQMRIHTQQTIGMLGGAVKPGEQDIGVQVIAARDPIDLQAQAGAMLVQALDVINVKSANAHIDWAAAKKISLSTVGGANITIDGGNITVQCPGKIEIKAGKKSFIGPAQHAYTLPVMPRSEMKEEPFNFKLELLDVPGKHGRPLAGRPWRIITLKNASGDPYEEKHIRREIASGVSTPSGECALNEAQKKDLWREVNLAQGTTFLVCGPNVTPLGMSNLTASAVDKDERKVLDAHNYAVAPGHADDAHKMLLKHWAELDYETRLTGSPKGETTV